MAKFYIAAQQNVEEENYFVSMTDMMVGLLFIFILILMYFALQFHNQVEKIGDASQTRKEIVESIKKKLEEKNIKVEVDPVNYTLHLPEDSLSFEKNSWNVDAHGLITVQALANALNEVLPCYANEEMLKKHTECGATKHFLEAVFIEGHTDSDAYKGVGFDNWDLSTKRAVSTYKGLIQAQPELKNLKNNDAKPQYLFSVSGYADQRPMPDNDNLSEEHKRRNRRIDLRFIMATPKYEDIKSVADTVGEKMR